MRTNRCLARLKAGKVAVVPTMIFDSPDLLEQAAHADLDGLFIDWQHGGWTEPTLQNALARFLSTDTTPIVRVKSHDPVLSNWVLDMGAMGVIVPMVQNADMARSAVRGCYYSPKGLRSMGGARLRLIGGSDWDDYFKHVNDEVLLIVMVETEEAIGTVEAIMRVEGVGCVMIGPSDLGRDVEAHGHTSEHFEKLVQQVADASKKTGVPCGYVCGTPDMAKRRIGQGYRFIAYGSDTGVVAAGMAKIRSDSKDW